MYPTSNNRPAGCACSSMSPATPAGQVTAGDAGMGLLSLAISVAVIYGAAYYGARAARRSR